MADNEASTQSPPDSAGGSLVTQADADAGEMSSGQMNTGESTAAINPAIQRITALTPMRTDSLEKVNERAGRKIPASRAYSSQKPMTADRAQSLCAVVESKDERQ